LPSRRSTIVVTGISTLVPSSRVYSQTASSAARFAVLDDVDEVVLHPADHLPEVRRRVEHGLAAGDLLFVGEAKLVSSVSCRSTPSRSLPSTAP